MILPGLLLIVFTGFSEEWLFRGLIQTTACNWLGPLAGVVFTAAGWSLLHIGWNSGLDVAYVFSIGLFWGWIRLKTESTWATSLAHGLANVVLFLILPWYHFGILSILAKIHG
jgi:membrane protease YdiL (CAAX protease family)